MWCSEPPTAGRHRSDATQVGSFRATPLEISDIVGACA